MGKAFAPTALSSACLPEGNEKLLLPCQLSIWWAEKREIKQVIHKSTKGTTALGGSSQWLRNTSCFFIGLDDLYFPEDFFLFFSSFFYFFFLQGEIVCLKCVTSRCWAQGDVCFQADNAENAWNEKNQIGPLSKFCRSSGGSSLKSSMKRNKVRAKEVEQPWYCSIILILFLGLGTLHLHRVVFSLKGN